MTAPSALCVLLVEDDPEVRAVIAGLLTKEGYAVRAASNPFDAYYMLEEGAVDLLITDIHMAGKVGGGILAQEVSRTWPEVRILVISGFDPEPDDLPPGAQFLAKPFGRDELMPVVERMMEV